MRDSRVRSAGRSVARVGCVCVCVCVWRVCRVCVRVPANRQTGGHRLLAGCARYSAAPRSSHAWHAKLKERARRTDTHPTRGALFCIVTCNSAPRVDAAGGGGEKNARRTAGSRVRIKAGAKNSGAQRKKKNEKKMFFSFLITALFRRSALD